MAGSWPLAALRRLPHLALHPLESHSSDWRSERKVGSGGSKRNTPKTAPRPHTSPAWHPPGPAVARSPPQMRKQASWGPCVACRPQGPREASKPHGRIAHSQHPGRSPPSGPTAPELAPKWAYRPQVLPGCPAVQLPRARFSVLGGPPPSAVSPFCTTDRRRTSPSPSVWASTGAPVCHNTAHSHYLAAGGA